VNLHSFEQREEPFFLDEQNSAVAVAGAGCGQLARQIRKLDGGQLETLCCCVQILAYSQRADANLALRMGLNQVAAVVVDHVPPGGFLRMLAHVFGQQRLGEIIVVERGAACDLENGGPCGAHDLAGMGRQRAAPRGLAVGVRHPPPGGVADRDLFRPPVAEEFFLAAGGAGVFAIAAGLDGNPFLEDLRHRFGDCLGYGRRQLDAAFAAVEEVEARHGDVQRQRDRILFVVYAAPAQEVFEAICVGAVCQRKEGNLQRVCQGD
jgi:hypothetical protein